MTAEPAERAEQASGKTTMALNSSVMWVPDEVDACGWKVDLTRSSKLMSRGGSRRAESEGKDSFSRMMVGADTEALHPR